jgi:hypothetical protein
LMLPMDIPFFSLSILNIVHDLRKVFTYVALAPFRVL